MSIILNLFGEGIRYWICDIPIAEYEKMKQSKEQQNCDWEQILFDLSFLKKFGYEHWSSMATRGEFKLFYLSNQNRIELKNKSKLLERIFTHDLGNSRTLIPLYQTKIVDNLTFTKIENSVSMILVQQETGLFAKYEINTDKLLFSDLEFHLVQQIARNEVNALSEIYFKGYELKQKKEETLIRSSKVWWISEI
jgi:hypothetical protein